MDLLSLPQEMLASVFKYSTYQTVTRIRKINQQVDRATLRYGVNKPRIDCVHSNGEYNEREIWYYESDLFEHKEKLLRTQDPESTTGGLVVWIVETLRMMRCNTICLNKIEVDGKLLNALNSYKDAKRVSIVLAFTNLTRPLKELKSVLSKFREVKLSMDEKNSTLEGSFATDRVIRCFIPIVRTYAINNCDYETMKTRCPEVTNESLRLALAYMPAGFHFYGMRTNFTIDQVLKSLRKIIESKELNHLNWNLGFIKINSTEELKQTINVLKSYPCVSVDGRYNTCVQPTNILLKAENRPEMCKTLMKLPYS